MDDHVAGVDQQPGLPPSSVPSALTLALPTPSAARGACRHRGEVPLRGAGRDHHEVGELVFPARLMTTGSIALSSSSECMTMSSTRSEMRPGLSASAMTRFSPLSRPRLPGPERGRRGRVRTEAHERPGRRLGRGQAARRRPPRAVRRVGDRRRARQRPVRIGMPLEDRNRTGLQHPAPVPPPRQLRQVVGPHQPDEPVIPPGGEPAEGVGRVARAQPRFQRQHT